MTNPLNDRYIEWAKIFKSGEDFARIKKSSTFALDLR